MTTRVFRIALRGSAGGVEPGDRPALLVGRDEEPGAPVVQRGGERREVGADVGGEHAHPGEPGIGGAGEPVRHRGAGETGQQDRVDQLLVGRHPFTAPATSPSVSRFCAITKNTITGIVISVDAAITAPHSVEFCPKNRRSPTATV